MSNLLFYYIHHRSVLAVAQFYNIYLQYNENVYADDMQFTSCLRI